MMAGLRAMMSTPWVTTSEAARDLGLTVGRVRQLLESGQLPGRKMGRDWVIRRADVNRFKSLPPGTRGRPRRVSTRSI
jgi:excisionase family DNA binding protein